MEFICSKSDLAEAINIVHRAVSSRTTLPILEGIYFEASDNKLKLFATDLEIGIENYISASVVKEGNVVISARIFADIVRKLPDADIHVKIDKDSKLSITCQNSFFILSGHHGGEFPEPPHLEEENRYIIPKDLFKNMIRQTTFAAALNETMPILTGVLLEVEGNEVNMVALDGYKLALRKAWFDQAQDNIKAVIPSKTLNEIGRILGNDDGNISISISSNQAIFKTENTKIFSRILEGEFINYKQIIPKDYKLRVTVNTRELQSSIERASLLAREGKSNLIKLSFNNDRLTITSNADIGSVNEQLNVRMDGSELNIAFNSKYFMDGLKVFDSEEVYLELTSSLSPCIVKPTDNNNQVYLVLPVRLN